MGESAERLGYLRGSYYNEWSVQADVTTTIYTVASKTKGKNFKT